MVSHQRPRRRRCQWCPRRRSGAALSGSGRRPHPAASGARQPAATEGCDGRCPLARCGNALPPSPSWARGASGSARPTCWTAWCAEPWSRAWSRSTWRRARCSAGGAGSRLCHIIRYYVTLWYDMLNCNVLEHVV